MRPDKRQGGFSLVELMVAMMITLIVSGAIYGLLASGGNAFRREPEVADRQQNIRIAMDLISRDIAEAGSGLPLVAQVFTHTDAPAGGPGPTGAGAPYLNGAGPQGVLGAAGQAQRGAPPTGTLADGSDNSDILEILIADESCPSLSVCNPSTGLNGAAGQVFTREQFPTANNSCLLATPGGRGLVALVSPADNLVFTIQRASQAAVGTGCGGAAGTNGQMRLEASLAEWPAARSLADSGGVGGLLYAGKVVRYLIAPSLEDPAGTEYAGAPALWRSESGRYDVTTGVIVAQPVLSATSPWQLVARGIEDLQVEYLNGGGLWSNNPGVVNVCPASGCTVPDYNNVVRRVRVTLSARALAPVLQGAIAPAAGSAAPNAVRGQLVSIITPRAALMGLQASFAATGWK
jgi:prepilin-type N-terminal cleavage/methylation domain-containing protein